MKTVAIVMLLVALFATGLWGHGQMILKQQALIQVNQREEAYNGLLKEFEGLQGKLDECLSLKEENELQNEEISYLEQFMEECFGIQSELEKKDFIIKHKDAEIAAQESSINALTKSLKDKLAIDSRVMTITAYTLSHDECGPDLTPALSSSECIVGETAAVSPDLSKWLGTHIYIEGFGVRYVNDLTSDRFTNRVDILVASKAEAFEIGCKKKIPVFKFL